MTAGINFWMHHTFSAPVDRSQAVRKLEPGSILLLAPFGSEEEGHVAEIIYINQFQYEDASMDSPSTQVIVLLDRPIENITTTFKHNDQILNILSHRSTVQVSIVTSAASRDGSTIATPATPWHHLLPDENMYDCDSS